MESIDVVLVSPPVETYSGFPLGIAILASIIRQQGVSVRIVDATPTNLSPQEILDEIRILKPKIVGLSGIIHTSAYLQKLSFMLDKLPDRPKIIAGGWWATHDPEFILRNTKVDFLVQGEADEIIAPLVQTLLRNSEPKQLPGVCTLDASGQFKQEPITSIPKDMDSIPYPAYDLFDMDFYSPILSPNDLLIPELGRKRTNGKQEFKYAMVYSGRGCYGKCDFCSAASMLRRNHSPKYVVDHMELLSQKYGADLFFFGESLTLTTRKWVTEFCNELLSRSFNCHYMVTSRADFKYDEDTLSLLQQSGCISAGIGFESGNNDMLTKMRKKVTVETGRKAIHDMKRHSIYTAGTFVLNMPGENLSSVRDTFRFMREISNDGVGYIGFGYAYPYPGTGLFQYTNQLGLCESDQFYFTTDQKRLNSREEFDSYFDKFNYNALNLEQMWELHNQINEFVQKHNKRLTELPYLQANAG